MQESRIQPKLEFALHIATRGPVLIEITSSQGQLEPALLSLRRKRQDAIRKERLPVA